MTKLAHDLATWLSELGRLFARFTCNRYFVLAVVTRRLRRGGALK